MASIHKDPRGKSPFWYCAYTLPNGKRRFKSTKQTERQKALEFCQGLGRAARESKSGNMTESRARDLISEIVEHALGEPLKFYTAEEWLRDWLKGKQVAKAQGTFIKYQRSIESFLDSLGERAKRNLNQITPRDIQRFRDAQIEEGKHPNTCNFAVKHLRMPFNVARRQGLITHNPAEAVEMLTVKGESSKRPFDLEQVTALLKAAEGDWRGAIMVAFYTGARLADVGNMRWSSVDVENQLISFRPGKTDKPLVVPMHDALHSFLLALPAPDSGKAFLFPLLAGKRVGGKSGLSMAFRRIMEKAKVAGEVARERKGKSGRTINTLSFHSLRHSFNSAMANAGVAEELRMKLSGHTTRDIHAHYTHHQLESLRVAIGALPKML